MAGRKGIWFLPRSGGGHTRPDFTFTEEGPLVLGTVLKSFDDPTSVLFSPCSDVANPEISFPPLQKTINETKHNHAYDESESAGLKILSQFLSAASVSSEVERGRQRTLRFSEVDHKILQYGQPLSKNARDAIRDQAAVREYIGEGIRASLIPKSVYIVTGLRIAQASFSVEEMEKTSSLNQLSAEGGGVAAGIPLNAEVGGLSNHEKEVKRSYHTEAGVVFAYKVNVMRRGLASTYAHSSGVMTGLGTNDSASLECIDIEKGDVGDMDSLQDVDEDGQLYCIWTPTQAAE